MAESTRLNVELDGDASGLIAATTQAEQGLKGVEQAAVAAGAGADKMGKAMGTASNRTNSMEKQQRLAAMQAANLGYQFNDIGVMLAAGQSPLMLAVQQGTQINQVFQQLGGTVGTIVPTLKAGLKSVINPMSLITMGGIALLAVFVKWGKTVVDTQDYTEKLAESLKELNSQMSEYVGLMRTANPLAGDIYDTMEKSIHKTSQAYQDLIAIAKVETLNKISAATDDLAASVLQYSYIFDEVGDAGNLLEIQTHLEGNITVWKENREVVKQFVAELKQLKNAATLNEQYEAALALRDSFSSLVDTSGEMTDRQLAFWKSLNESLVQMELMGAASDALVVSGTERLEISGAMRTALSAEDLIMGQMVEKSAAMVKLERERKELLDKISDSEFRTAEDTLMSQMGLEVDPANEYKKKGGRGGGKSPLDRTEEDYERLRESLLTEEEIQMEAYARQKEIADAARAQGIIDEMQYQQMLQDLAEQHADKLIAIDARRYGTQAQKTEQFLSDMAAITTGGNKRLLKIAKVFGAAEALINSYKAFTDVLADSSLQWWQKIPAALSVLGAGLGMVNAIRSVSETGAGGGAAGAGAGAGQAAAQAPAARSGPAVSLTLIGEQGFTRAQVVQIAEALNDASDDGNELITLRGRR